MSEEAIPTNMLAIVINTLHSNKMTPAEAAMGHSTHRKLQKLENWKEWLQGETDQLNDFHQQGMFGIPTDPATIPKDSVILRPHWNYMVKQDGRQRSRFCCDGSKRAAPQLHAAALTWSSCVQLPVLKMFLGMSATLQHKLYSGDAKDAYAHSDPPDARTFLSIDSAYADWFQTTFKRPID